MIKNCSAHFKGDVNIPFSFTIISVQTMQWIICILVNSQPTSYRNLLDTIEVDLDIQKIEDEIIITLTYHKIQKVL